MATEFLNQLMESYCIGGSVDAVTEKVGNSVEAKVLIERAQWLVRSSGVPTTQEMAALVCMIQADTPKPLKMAILACFVRLQQEIEVLKNGAPETRQ